LPAVGDSLERRFASNPDVSWKDIGGEIVLVHLGTNRIYELNRTGARLWTLLDEGRTRSEAEDILAREFDIDTQSVAAETNALIEELLQLRLIEER
jgi:Coenzyme PQQ synthesis protein D (PqqD)